ncbi:MAG: phosphoglucosamine mutase [Candidatus Eremiobacteraeota bacterium]|nr:phosphoglucosamine mutase [Candidatus Eremiobacteraeota bacterium]
MSRLFGTDGIRGVANRDLTPELALQIGRAAAATLGGGDRRPILVGRDTRLSGSMLEGALVAGITSAGVDAVSLGIVPTPAVACVARATGAAAGIVISASHNPIADNGLKFFGSDGFKLTDSLEGTIEALVESPDLPRPSGTGVGVARVSQNFGRHYYRELYEDAVELSGLHVVVDGAFGAAYAFAPYALRKLGAQVVEINCEADGARINVNCGATDLRALQAAVRAQTRAGKRNVLGVAFDGDADRALFVDEAGACITGDHVLFALACAMRADGQLRGDAVVATVMSNIGLERALRARGIELLRAPVGDRYVLEKMRAEGYVLGGEQSGHVIDFRHNTTGDGPRTAVTLLGLVASTGSTLHELVRDVVSAPQLLVNVRTSRSDVLEEPAVIETIAAAQAALGTSGRLLVRASGTEPLIRVMAEGDDPALVEAQVSRVAARIEQEVARFIST